jgi:cytochrome P450 family 6
MFLSCYFFLNNAISIAVVLVAVFFGYYKWTYFYWEKRKVPYLRPKIPYGNSVSPFQDEEQVGFKMKQNYEELKSRGLKHGGIFIFLQPINLIVDLGLVRYVMTTHFNHFSSRGVYYNEEADPLGANLVAISGPKWKNLRKKISPSFSPHKLKTMFSTMLTCEDNLLKNVDSKSGQAVDIRHVAESFTIDVYGSCAFGLDCESFKSEDSPFRTFGLRSVLVTRFIQLKTMFAMSFPTLARILGLKLIAEDISKFFSDVVTRVVTFREKNNVRRNDLLQFLIDLKYDDPTGDKSLTLEEITAQCYVFFVAGFDSTASCMTFALYELSKNPDIQEKLRNEITEVLSKHQNNLTYDAIQDMEYLDQVVNETLRKYPPAPLTVRECTKDYNLPDANFVVEEGTAVAVPILGIHYDQEYYPNPEEFDPERFNQTNKTLRPRYSFIPFGEGPRYCIGERGRCWGYKRIIRVFPGMSFARMQIKAGLVSLLRSYEFGVSRKTEEPVKIKASSFVLAAKETIWLDVQKIEK